MKDEKELLCDECNSKIIKDEIRVEYYCSNCGLVQNSNHPMGRAFGGLRDYMVHSGLSNYIEEARVIYKMEGLAKVRLWVSKL